MRTFSPQAALNSLKNSNWAQNHSALPWWANDNSGRAHSGALSPRAKAVRKKRITLAKIGEPK